MLLLLFNYRQTRSVAANPATLSFSVPAPEIQRTIFVFGISIGDSLLFARFTKHTVGTLEPESIINLLLIPKAKKEEKVPTLADVLGRDGVV